MTIAEDDIVSSYHEPIWLRGLHDPPGVLKNAMETGHIVDNCEVNVTEEFAYQEEAAGDFVQTVCRLNGLKSLRLLPDKFSTIYAFPVNLLTTALQEATGLQMLSLCSLELQGSPDEFERWMYWLRNHQSVNLVRLIRCRLPEQTALLDTLILSLWNMTNLKEVELSAAEESAWYLSHDSF